MNNQDTYAFDVLARAFPFHFVVNDDLRFVRAGQRLLEMTPSLRGGGLMTDQFRIERPELKATAKELRARSETVFILQNLTFRYIFQTWHFWFPRSIFDRGGTFVRSKNAFTQ